MKTSDRFTTLSRSLFFFSTNTTTKFNEFTIRRKLSSYLRTYIVSVHTVLNLSDYFYALLVTELTTGSQVIMLKRSFALVCGLPTKVVTVGPGIADKPKDLVLVIPGNAR